VGQAPDEWAPWVERYLKGHQGVGGGGWYICGTFVIQCYYGVRRWSRRKEERGGGFGERSDCGARMICASGMQRWGGIIYTKVRLHDHSLTKTQLFVFTEFDCFVEGTDVLDTPDLNCKDVIAEN
jgi:hypothetical protein